MRTLKDHLSQKIYEIPSSHRRFTGNILLPLNLTCCIINAIKFVSDKLNKEDRNNPISLFTEDRLDYLESQFEGTEEEVDISFDVDTLTLMRACCEYALKDSEEFLKETSWEKTHTIHYLNQGANLLTAKILEILTNRA